MRADGATESLDRRHPSNIIRGVGTNAAMPLSNGWEDPPARYAITSDGVRIAYWTFGNGPPLVYLAGGPWSHIELSQVPECQRWYARLAQSRMLVRYDIRGTGQSARRAADLSLDALVRDVEAVVEGLSLERFALFAAADAGPVAVSFAAQHPEQVEHLILWCTWAKNADIRSPRIQAWLGLLDQDWELMTDTCAQIVLGWSGDVGRRAAQHLRENISPEAMRAALDAYGQFDVTHLLQRIQARTLVVHRSGISWIPVDIARTVVSGIPNAQLAVLPGESTAPYLGDLEKAAETVNEFLNTGTLSPSGGQQLDESAHLKHVAARPRSKSRPDRLTGREVEVLRLLAGGLTNDEIAKELVLSVRTVERHVANVYGKIGARRRVDASVYALTRGLI